MKKLTSVLLILVVIGAVLGVAGFRIYKKMNMKKSETTTDIQARQGIPVEAVLIGRGDIESRLAIYGTLKGRNEVPINPKVGGRIQRIYVENGDRVRAGQVLVQIETKEINDQVNQARAALAGARQQEAMVYNGARDQERRQAQNMVDQAEQGFAVAESTLKRMDALFKQGIIAQQQYDSVKLQYDLAKSQLDNARQQLDMVKEGARDEQKEMAKQGVKQAEAAVAFAESQLGNASVVSPVSGVVSSRMFDVGTLVGPSMPYPLMTIVDDSSFSLKADISEVDLDKVRIGQPVELTIDAIPGMVFSGKISEINPSASMGTRTYTLKVDVENRDKLMKSGLFARGSVKVQSKAGVLKVPKDALVKRAGEQGVFVIGDCKNSEVKGSKSRTCKVSFTPIEIGIVNTLTVEAVKGLNEGDEIVLTGAAGLNNGDKVSVEKILKVK